MERLATLPFVAQPGEAWVYGYNTDILGCIVGAGVGHAARRADSHAHHRTARAEGHAVLPAGGAARSAGGRLRERRDGQITRAPDGASGQGHYVDGPRRSFAGGAGLLSTARDYARFLEMIRNGGALDGVRILSPRTVDLMTTNQVGTLHSSTGLGFGLGFETTDRYGANGLDSVGAFGWGGAYGSDLPRRSERQARAGADDPADAQPKRHPRPFPDARLPGSSLRGPNLESRIPTPYFFR